MQTESQPKVEWPAERAVTLGLGSVPTTDKKIQAGTIITLELILQPLSVCADGDAIQAKVKFIVRKL